MKTSQLPTRNSTSDMWSDKYSPRCTSDLAVSSKKVEAVRDWLVSSHAGHLLIVYGPPGSGKSTMINTILHEVNITPLIWTDRPVGSGEREMYVSQADDFTSFLTRCSSYKPLLLKSNKTVVIMEDVPLKLGALPSHVCDALYSFASTSINDGILLLSSISHLPALRKLLSAKLIDSPHVTIIEVPSVSDTNMFKALSRICDQGKVCIDDICLHGIVASSCGDIRHAVNNLQFKYAEKPMTPIPSFLHGYDDTNRHSTIKRRTSVVPRGWKVPSDWLVVTHEGGSRIKMYISPEGTAKCKSIPDVYRYLANSHGSNEANSQEGESRNKFMDEMHVIGKLLHPPKSKGLHNTESILDESSFDAYTVSLFVMENMIPYFTDIEELSNAMDVLSHADVFMGGKWGQTQSGTSHSFVDNYISSLTVRAIPVHNGHPAAPSFRPIRKPEIFYITSTAKNRIHSIGEIFHNTVASFLVDNVAFMNYITPYTVTLSSTTQRIIQDVNHYSDLYEGGRTQHIYNVVAGTNHKRKMQSSNMILNDDIEDY